MPTCYSQVRDKGECMRAELSGNERVDEKRGFQRKFSGVPSTLVENSWQDAGWEIQLLKEFQ